MGIEPEKLGCVWILWGKRGRAMQAESTEALWELVSPLVRLACGRGWHTEGQACEWEVRMTQVIKGTS